MAVTIGGVRTNFRMPDVIPSAQAVAPSCVSGMTARPAGPDSVGYEITKALVFGGDVMTATDIAVRLGMVELGDKSKVEPFLRKWRTRPWLRSAHWWKTAWTP